MQTGCGRGWFWTTILLHCRRNGEAINDMMDAVRHFNVALEKIEAITTGGAPVMTGKINGAVTGNVPTTKYLLVGGMGVEHTSYPELMTLLYPLPQSDACFLIEI